MTYITTRRSARSHQVTFEELLLGTYREPAPVPGDPTATHTYKVENVSEVFLGRINVEYLVRILENYNQKYTELARAERSSLYRTFSIPKKSGGLRRIDAPNDELMLALRELKDIFEHKFGALYHTTAFAYISGRNTLSAVKRHQQNESRWYAKYDFHGFFPSTTMDFVLRMFSMVFPFSEVMKDNRGRAELERALDLCFLNGGLPQGTPISPLITNIMMIPFDFELTNALRKMEGKSFVNTRYADDTIVSSKVDFSVREIEELIKSILASFDAPFTINSKKTRYGSSAGRNWNLGLMVNKDNEITVGHKNKRRFQCILHNYATDKRNGVAWPLEDIREVLGLHSYYCMVERETIAKIVQHVNQKEGMDVISEMKRDIA